MSRDPEARAQFVGLLNTATVLARQVCVLEQDLAQLPGDELASTAKESLQREFDAVGHHMARISLWLLNASR